MDIKKKFRGTSTFVNLKQYSKLPPLKISTYTSKSFPKNNMMISDQYPLVSH